MTQKDGGTTAGQHMDEDRRPNYKSAVSTLRGVVTLKPLAVKEILRILGRCQQTQEVKAKDELTLHDQHQITLTTVTTVWPPHVMIAHVHVVAS